MSVAHTILNSHHYNYSVSLKTFHFPSFGGGLKGRPTKKSRFLEVPYTNNRGSEV